ncbi:MAG TPA: hypothetical protein VMM35_08255 [Longimicrobiales bacterium]|nr:hypothetical protein [Longimicrobiales bacterium]
MLRTLLRTLAVAASAATLAAPAHAQIAWDGPALMSPTVPSGFSIFLMNPEGGDLGVLATLRSSAGPVGLGFRAALADQAGSGDLAFAGGVDVAGVLARAVEGSEIDVAWWSGAGVGVGNEALVTFPLGVTLGWSGAGGDVVFSPYGGGHVVLDFLTGGGDNVRFAGVVDLGLDLVLTSGWMVRMGASLGDRESLALGIRLPGGGS